MFVKTRYLTEWKLSACPETHVNSQALTIVPLIAIFSYFAGIVSAEEPASCRLPDHLLPADRETLGKEYMALVERKLCVTPFDDARVLILPAFAGEESLSVYSWWSGRGHGSHYATWTVASENLNRVVRVRAIIQKN